jgi:hypothetical protein
VCTLGGISGGKPPKFPVGIPLPIGTVKVSDRTPTSSAISIAFRRFPDIARTKLTGV